MRTKKSNEKFVEESPDFKEIDRLMKEAEINDGERDARQMEGVMGGATPGLMRPVGVKEHLLHQMSPTNKNLSDFWFLQQEWSQATFGTDKERGPAGPLEHLAKEVEELRADPTDIMEYVDCIFLIIDAARRQGYSFYDVMDALFLKLKQNVMRKWDAPQKNRAVEHVRRKR